jgi:hypothetical protein
MGQARRKAEHATDDTRDDTTRVVERRVTDRVRGRECAWCGTWMYYSGRGRPARYCSKSCRQRGL